MMNGLPSRHTRTIFIHSLGCLSEVTSLERTSNEAISKIIELRTSIEAKPKVMRQPKI